MIDQEDGHLRVIDQQRAPRAASITSQLSSTASRASALVKRVSISTDGANPKPRFQRLEGESNADGDAPAVEHPKKKMGIPKRIRRRCRGEVSVPLARRAALDAALHAAGSKSVEPERGVGADVPEKGLELYPFKCRPIKHAAPSSSDADVTWDGVALDVGDEPGERPPPPQK